MERTVAVILVDKSGIIYAHFIEVIRLMPKTKFQTICIVQRFQMSKFFYLDQPETRTTCGGRQMFQAKSQFICQGAWVSVQERKCITQSFPRLAKNLNFNYAGQSKLLVGELSTRFFSVHKWPMEWPPGLDKQS